MFGYEHMTTLTYLHNVFWVVKNSDQLIRFHLEKIWSFKLAPQDGFSDLIANCDGIIKR
jgi:hypothetical protein